MSIRGIVIYTLRAAIFAASVCAIYALVCRLRGHRLRWERLLAVAYFAALVQITVLRGGVDWARVLAGGRGIPQLIPLRTTLSELRGGLWRFIYHTVGNLSWFAPLGLMLRRKGPGTALLAGAGMSAMIELMQFLLRTGVTDIDDVIFNALGALLGWAIGRLVWQTEPRSEK